MHVSLVLSDKMSFSSSLLTIIFITALLCPLYSGALLTPQRHSREEPDCDRYIGRLYSCTRELRPVCGTNEQTYSNRCLFCSAMLESDGAFGLKHYGPCESS
ncbi:sperm-associated acrosin inhibitor-like [Myotis daubentonii]|uniref:sperm-associated acrosin inhibitor-like n=1 Tax=Myotis daubentonii TaxID=98922 RepID=UPI0028738D8B|nr:sperm-associated acrosin inhibitor-like [Myotis daubentonii]